MRKTESMRIIDNVLRQETIRFIDLIKCMMQIRLQPVRS